MDADDNLSMDDLIAGALMEEYRKKQHDPNHPEFSPTESNSRLPQELNSFQSIYDSI
jgi:hypothetical protein